MEVISPMGVSCPRSGRGLPVLQLLSDTFGESATKQPHQEEERHTSTNHSEDVVLGW